MASQSRKIPRLQLVFFSVLIVISVTICLANWSFWKEVPVKHEPPKPVKLLNPFEHVPSPKPSKPVEPVEPSPSQELLPELPASLAQLAQCLCKCFTHDLTGPERPHEFLEISSKTQCYSSAFEDLSKLRRWVAENVRVFMYNMGTKSEGKIRGTYNIEANFFRLLGGSEFRTHDPARANLFFMPLFPSDYRKNVGSRGVAEECKSATQSIANKYSQFVQMKGRRHFFVSGRDQGKPCCLAHQPLGEMMSLNSSALVNTADPFFRYGTWSRRRKRLYQMVASPQKLNKGEAIFSQYNFVPSRDVTMPCTMDEERADWAWKSLPDDAPFKKRKTLALFAGSVNRVPLRMNLNKSVGGHPEVRMISGKLPPEDYKDALLSSTFCMCPKGAAVWSPRLMEAIWFGCIPVIIADHYWVPFSCFFDWQELAVFIPEDEVLTTYDRIRAITPESVKKMQKGLREVREFLRGNTATLHQIMTELYLKQLVCPWKVTSHIFTNKSDPSKEDEEEKQEARANGWRPPGEEEGDTQTGKAGSS